MKKSRLIAVLAALTLSIGLLVALPVTAYADDFSVGSNAELKDALDNLTGDDTITLTADITLEDSYYGDTSIEVLDDLVIDLAGYNLILDGIGLEAYGNLTITGDGNLTCTLIDVGGSLVIDAVNVSLTYGYIWVGASSSATALVNANLTFVGSYGVYVEDGASATVNGNITMTGIDSTAVYAEEGSIVTVTGNIVMPSSGSIGVRAYSGSDVTVTGNIVAALGAVADGAGTTVTIEGDVEANAYGLNAQNGASLNLTGNILAGYNAVFAGNAGSEVYVIGNVTSTDSTAVVATDGGYIDIEGNISADYIGVSAYDEDTIVLVTGDIDAYVGVEAWDGALVGVEGAITALYVGIIVGTDNGNEPGGYVVLYGTITVPESGDYIRLYTSADGYEARSIDEWNLDDYELFADGDIFYVYYDLASAVYVWRAALEPPLPPTTTTPDTGDLVALFGLSAAAASLAGATGTLVYRKRRKSS